MFSSSTVISSSQELLCISIVCSPPEIEWNTRRAHQQVAYFGFETLDKVSSMYMKTADCLKTFFRIKLVDNDLRCL
jgi:hypothetical protein